MKIVCYCVIVVLLIHFSVSDIISGYDIYKEIDDLLIELAKGHLNLPELEAVYCDQTLGCFPIDGPFKDRKANLRPNSREIINTKFMLFTRLNKESGQLLKAEDLQTISASSFDSRRPTKFIIHGFTSSMKASWCKEMTAELLKNSDFNVILVDWSGIGASKTLYTQATANTRVVAAEIAHLLKTMTEKFRLRLSDAHLIGHSLGAHIAGYVGAKLKGLGRISGMDPAGPYFEGYSTEIRLDPQDADFVDVIHSDSKSILNALKLKGGFGTRDISGHADFFPNGGENQPGCPKGSLDCSHGRAHGFYTHSINNNCFTPAVTCKDYSDFEHGRCLPSCDSHECNKMGFHAHKPTTIQSGVYYLHTGSLHELCTEDLTARIAIRKESYDEYGTLDLRLQTGSGKTYDARLNTESDVLSGDNEYDYLIGLPANFKPITNLWLTFTEDVNWWRFITKICGWLRICKPMLRVHSVQIISKDESERITFCGMGNEFLSGQEVSMALSSTECPEEKSFSFF